MAEELELKDSAQQPSDNGGYDKLVTLTPREHIRLRPGMYIGKLGDGSQSDDGIYVLIKEVMDNSIDEFNTGFAKQPIISIDVEDGSVTIRDYGRGIPLDQVKKHLLAQGVPQTTIDSMPSSALKGVQKMLSIVPPKPIT